MDFPNWPFLRPVKFSQEKVRHLLGPVLSVCKSLKGNGTQIPPTEKTGGEKETLIFRQIYNIMILTIYLLLQGKYTFPETDYTFPTQQSDGQEKHASWVKSLQDVDGNCITLQYLVDVDVDVV